MTFTRWLRGHEHEDNPIGDVATDARRDDDFPRDGNLDVYRQYIRRRTRDPKVLDAFDEAWRLYVREQKHPPKYTPAERQRIADALKPFRHKAMYAAIDFARRYGKTSAVHKKATKIHQAIDAFLAALDDVK